MINYYDRLYNNYFQKLYPKHNGILFEDYVFYDGDKGHTVKTQMCKECFNKFKDKINGDLDILDEDDPDRECCVKGCCKPLHVVIRFSMNDIVFTADKEQ